jgi:hypothetical protein
MNKFVIKQNLYWFMIGVDPARFDGKQTNRATTYPFYISYYALKSEKAIRGYQPSIIYNRKTIV